MADSTLAAIRKKVRRITRSPSEQQISTADIDEYINTFIQYDLPQELRLTSLRKTLTFYTEPNIETYETNAVVGDPLENFKNVYTAVHNPIYVAGYEARLSQSEAEFYGLYPFTNTITTETTGDGITVFFTGTLSAVPVVRNRVVFNSIDLNGDNLVANDDGSGTFDGDAAGTIDYETGAWTLTWALAPGANENINSLTVPYVPARPDTVLFFDNKFVVRPIPDQSYPVQVEVDVRPTEVILAGEYPDLEQWWQYIAYGAIKKVFEDRSDMDSVQEIMPELKRQEALVNRRTIVNLAKERSSTIYSNGLGINLGSRNL
jgi:hypothetical protein